MLTRVGGGESEASLRCALLVDDTVIIVERLFDGNGDIDIGGATVDAGSIIPGLSFVVAYEQNLSVPCCVSSIESPRLSNPPRDMISSEVCAIGRESTLTNYKCVLGKLLVEALWRWSIEEEVQRIRRQGQKRQEEESESCTKAAGCWR